MSHREDIAAEFDEAGSQGREWLGGDGYSFRRPASLKDAAFARLCAKLQQNNWRMAHTEKVREFRERAETKPERIEYRRNWKRAARDERWAGRKLLTCGDCGRQFERRKRVGPIPKFCSERCYMRAWHHAHHPGAEKRLARRKS